MASAAKPATFRETLLLRRVGTTSELCSVVESAQYARVFLYDEPATNEHALTIEAFIAVFATATEGWDAAHLPNKAPLVEALRMRLRELEAIGLFVHAACIERQIVLADDSRIALPIAVIGIDTDPAPTRTAALPAQLRACGAIPDDGE
jgi:hypothetical protein